MWSWIKREFAIGILAAAIILGGVYGLKLLREESDRQLLNSATLVKVRDGGNVYQVEYKDQICWFYTRHDLKPEQFEKLHTCLTIPTAVPTTVVER